MRNGATFSALRPWPGQLWPGMSKAKPPVWESAGTALRLAWLEMIWMGWTLWSPYSGMGYHKNRASNQRFLETIMNCLWFGTLLTRWLGGLQSLGSCWSQHQIWCDISIFLGFATHFLVYRIYRITFFFLTTWTCWDFIVQVTPAFWMVPLASIL